jgi:phenylalanyl-tRNA synthetase alpha chain
VDLISEISKLEQECLAAVLRCQNSSDLTQVHDTYFSKKGKLSEVLKELRNVPADQKPLVGAKANQTKVALENAFQEKRNTFELETLNAKLESERVDISLPSSGRPVGSTHPISAVISETVNIFKRLGFELASGPEAETEFFNFDALNIPDDHPARDMQDTFYVKVPHTKDGQRVILRTHTSPVQIRTMKNKKPPLRVISAGAVFRSDYDITHTPMFHQVEGFYADEHVSFAELKGTLLFFAREMFGAETKIRLRPSFFPFVEPGAEVDVTCLICKGKGCRVCKDSGWLEILGAGMIHPNVFKSVDYAAGKVSGFAFGMGMERIAMLKYGIGDLRTIFENDVRFLRQFGV